MIQILIGLIIVIIFKEEIFEIAEDIKKLFKKNS